MTLIDREAAAKEIRLIAKDWRDAGDMMKVYAADYLAVRIMSLPPVSEPDVAGPTPQVDKVVEGVTGEELTMQDFLAIAFLARKLERELNALAARPDGWVSVDERLPDCGDRVLVFWALNYGWVETAMRHHEGHFVNADNFELYGVTHWQPLPKHPTDISGGHAAPEPDDARCTYIHCPRESSND